MSALDIDNNSLGDGLPIVYVLSDSRGETGAAVVKAAAAQFGDGIRRDCKGSKHS